MGRKEARRASAAEGRSEAAARIPSSSSQSRGLAAARTTDVFAQTRTEAFIPDVPPKRLGNS